jgi:hypothetical protein
MGIPIQLVACIRGLLFGVRAQDTLLVDGRSTTTAHDDHVDGVPCAAK